MIDPFGRAVTYLRVSVTDRCNYRCNYCMAEDMTFLPRKDLLTLEELQRICSVFIGLGVQKLRITGGEPLVRRDILSLFEHLGAQLGSGLEELTLTTNGALLDRFSKPLKDLGVKRVNVSLDTLDKAKFEDLTRLGKYDDVIRGIDAAVDAGLKIKINAVALKGVNDSEMDQLISWCGDKGFDLSVIESMPMGDIGQLRDDHFWSLEDAKADIEKRWTLTPSDYQTGGPSRYHNIAQTGLRIGFIAPYSHNFCESCNRVRLTCTGVLYLCLGQDDSVDLRAPMRDGASDAELSEIILKAIERKPKGHDFDHTRLADGAQVVRFMNTTGG